ncbi:MAG: hypothetical protein J6C93_06310 [Clostridia bacterium]|nr:hypothetical protein [Clostridia bacterium]
MRKLKTFLLLFVATVCTFVLAACGEPTAYSVKFVNDDDSVLLELSVNEGETPEYTLEDPEKEATAQYTYTFVGWDKAISPATEDVTYKATYSQTVNKYTVTFVDEDGTVLQSGEIEYGQTPVYAGETPTKAATVQNTYTFGGWDSEIAAVTGNATYTATYTPVVNEYQVTFMDLEGEVLFQDMVAYGEVPVYGGETPALEGNAQYSYTFEGWTPVLAPVDGEATYRPVFERHVNEYTVTFVDEEGEVLQTGKVPYGTVPVFEGTLPLPEDTAEYEYTGAWDNDIVAVTGEATYTYIVTESVRTYEIKFVNDDGTVLKTIDLEYGETPVFEKIPYKAATEATVYTFDGWDSEIAAVAGDKTYTATYASAQNTYEAVIAHVTVDGFVAAAPAKQAIAAQGLQTYMAPTLDGLTASHQTYKFNYAGDKVLAVIYYSEVDVWDGTSVSQTFVGDGTAENPYLIQSGADLALLRANVNAGNSYAGQYFKMTKSIDLNGVSLMIGSSSTTGAASTNTFGGTFDGNNCSILNVATNETTTGQYAALFKGLIAGGKVANLSTYGAYNQTVKMNGVIVGFNYGTVENCTNYVSVTPAEGASVGEIHRYTAGIVSWNCGTILSCVNYGNMSGEEYASGIASRSDDAACRVEGCINYGTVTGTGFRAGGIIGFARYGTVAECANFGSASTAATSSDSQVGGIAGLVSYATLTDCVNYGTVSSTANANYVGGIAGFVDTTDGTITGCDNYGEVSGYKYAAGIVGKSSSAITDCVNYGKVTGRSNYAAGIVGQMGGALSNCDNRGDVTGTYDMGGVVGGVTITGTLSNCDNYGKVTGSQKMGGIAGLTECHITDCNNYGEVVGSIDFVGGIVGASYKSSDGSRTITNCNNYANVTGKNYVGGIDGRPYGGVLNYVNCSNTATVKATGNYAGGIAGSIGRTNKTDDNVTATLDGCINNGAVVATYPGALVGEFSDTPSTLDIKDNCSTTIKNMYYIGRNTKLGAPAGDIHRTFVIEFVDEDGEVLQTETLDEGTMPVFKGTLPTLPENTDYCTYTGAWDKEIVAATANATYTYVITATYEKYTVQFVDEDGEVLYETQVEWGQTPVYGGETPTKQATTEKVYEFAGWTPEIAAITGETTYTVVFEEKDNEYTVTFVDEDGEELQTGKVAYGVVPTFTGTLPTLPEDTAQYAYTGAWDKEIVAVTEDATYTYIITQTVRSYQIKFVNDDGTVYYDETLEYGETPVFEKIPYKAATTESVYTFNGWDSEVAAVAGDKTYTATYMTEQNTYAAVIAHVTIDGFVAYDAAKITLEEQGLQTYTAPVVEGLTASHQTYKYNYVGEKVLAVIYYSEVDVWDGTSVSQTFVGEGTAENPYLIQSGADLALLRQSVNAGSTFADTYFKMTKSIDLNNVGFMIGTSATVAFGGTFDGNNCSLLNLNTNELTGKEYTGLFRYLLTGSKVSNLSTYGEYNRVNKFSGVIAGHNYGTIENVTNYVSVTVASGTTAGNMQRYGAGIAGYTNGDIIGCVNYGAIGGEEYASGIVSRLNAAAKIENCINYGNIKGAAQKTAGIVAEGTAGGNITGCVNFGSITGTSRSAGIVGGKLTNATVTDCINYGDVTLTGDYAAGIVGAESSVAVIENCVNYGNITADQWVGGIAGRNGANITDCINYGTITETAGNFVGGIVGASSGTRTISGCINYGAVIGTNYAGGIDGRPYADTLTIVDCINNGTVTCSGTYAGGIVGRTDVAHTTLINCQSNGEVTATYAGVYVGLNSTTETTGYVIYDSCSTTLTGNAIGYDNATAAGIPLEGFAYTATPTEE